MSDLIRRQDAIKAITQLPVKVDNLGYTWMIAIDVLKQVDDVPSAETERKTGEWIYDTERVMNNGGIYSQYHCSECGFQSVSRMNFCGYCGSDMRGE